MVIIHLLGEYYRLDKFKNHSNNFTKAICFKNRPIKEKHFFQEISKKVKGVMVRGLITQKDFEECNNMNGELYFPIQAETLTLGVVQHRAINNNLYTIGIRNELMPLQYNEFNRVDIQDSLISLN